MSSRAKQMSTAEAFITFHKDLMLEARTSLPGKISGVNVVNGKLISVDVQLGIQQLATAKDKVNIETLPAPIVPGVPYVIPRSQTTGFSLTVPIVVGDDALLVFADRSIDNWQSTGKVAAPAEPVIPRTHDITDAIAVIGITNDMTGIANYDMDRIMMRNADKNVCMSVSNDAAEIKNGDLKILLKNGEIIIENGGLKIMLGGGEILLENGASSITMESNQITIDSPLIILSGDALEMASTTNTTTGGGLSSSGGLDFDNHIHSDPQGGNTGPPVNP